MDTWVPTNPNFTAVPCPYKEYSFAEQLGFVKQLNSLNADLVHFSMPQQPVLYNGAVVTTIQDLTTARFRNPDKNIVVFWIKQQIYKWLIKYVSRKSKHLIAISDFVRHDIAEYASIPLDKITVTHEAVDDFDEAPAPLLSVVGKRYIMGDGRARPHKNLARQIEAFAKVHETHPDLYFLLTGKQDEAINEHKRRIEELGLSEFVIIAGFIPDGQLKWAMAHCQAYIWASLSEGFGLPPLEAMLHGAPVASSNASCMPEVLGEAAHYFDPYDTDAMAQAISELVDNPELQETLKQRGAQQVQRYSWKRMAEQSRAVYEKVLSGA
jgi:glycosyltransferase involved in cell wall biosynthesis